MKQVNIIIIMLLWSLSASSQELSDSTHWGPEMEDSLGLLSIKPVKNPHKLLKQVINRLQKDLQETHRARKYLIEGTFKKLNYPLFHVSSILPVEGDNGLEIIKDYFAAINDMSLEDFSFELPQKLSSRDSFDLKKDLLDYIYISPAHPNNGHISRHFPFVNYGETVRWFSVEAYEIDYGVNRGMYRIHLKKGHNRYKYKMGDRMHWLGDYIVTAYFDRSSLRVIQIKGEYLWKVQEYPFNLWPETTWRFKAEYDEERGTPVLSQILYIMRTSNSKAINGVMNLIKE